MLIFLHYHFLSFFFFVILFIHLFHSLLFRFFLFLPSSHHYSPFFFIIFLFISIIRQFQLFSSRFPYIVLLLYPRFPHLHYLPFPASYMLRHHRFCYPTYIHFIPSLLIFFMQVFIIFSLKSSFLTIKDLHNKDLHIVFISFTVRGRHT